MKKIKLFLMSLMIVALGACGGEKPEETPPEKEQTMEEMATEKVDEMAEEEAAEKIDDCEEEEAAEKIDGCEEEEAEK